MIALASMKKYLLQPVILICLFVSAAHAQVTLKISPPAIGPDYTGNLMVQIAGLTNGETVKLGRFFDANANGTVDAPDLRIMGVTLRDGQVSLIGGATNINVPIDLDPAGGSMNFLLNQSATGFEQKMPGQHIFRLVSPSGRFAPVNALLTVTNAGFGQSISGNVTSAGSAVPYAWIVLFRAGGKELSYPAWCAIADGAGHYSLNAPVGAYSVMAVQSNFVSDLSAMASVTLSDGASVTADLTVSPATGFISGGLIDSAHTNNAFTAIGIVAISSDNHFAFGLTATNGEFLLPVTAGSWNLSVDEHNDIALFRYLEPSEIAVDATSGSISNLSIEMTRASALVYGSLKDGGGNPLPGIRVQGENNGVKGLGITDQDGNFAIGLTGGNWNFSVDDQDPAIAGYIVAGLDMLTLSDGQAVRRDLTALKAGRQISGSLKDWNGVPISGVSIWAGGNLNGLQVNVNSQPTDAQGNFTLSVTSGQWAVGVSTGSGDSSLDPSYLIPPVQMVDVSNVDVTVSFIALKPSAYINGALNTPDGGPIPGVWINAAPNFNGGQIFYGAVTDENGNYSFGVPAGTWNVAPACFGGNQTLNAVGYECVDQKVASVSNVNVTVNFSASRCQGPHMPMTTLPDGDVGVGYSMNLYATGCYAPFSWSLTPASAPLPEGLQIRSDGLISGNPGVSGHFDFQVVITDSMKGSATTNLFITIWPPAPKFTGVLPGNGWFGMQVSGATNQTYSVQYSTNIAGTNWIPLLLTNSRSSSFPVIDYAATNSQRFYRILVAP